MKDGCKKCTSNKQKQKNNKEMRKIYISGKISGMPKEKARSIFRAAETRVKSTYPNARVVNPFNNGLPENAPYEQHIAKDLEMLAECDTIYMLPNWESSNGAKLEHKYATTNGLRVIYEKEVKQ